jgi:hypothetical protein
MVSLEKLDYSIMRRFAARSDALELWLESCCSPNTQRA